MFRKKCVPFYCLAMVCKIMVASFSPLHATVLQNEHLRLELGYDQQGFPCIKRLQWRSDYQAIFSHQDHVQLNTSSWLPAELSATSGAKRAEAWNVTHDSLFVHATSVRRMQNLLACWHVLLMRNQDLFRVFVELKSLAGPVPVSWYPIWSFSWDMPGTEPALTFWQALSYQQQERVVSAGPDVVLGSKRYSSDGEEEDGESTGMSGQMPFWQLHNSRHRLSFSLAWCGGWRAEMSGQNSQYTMRAWLPPAETQLVLKPGESIQGPAMTVYVQKAGNVMADRSAWFSQRDALARSLYPQPPPSFPLIYNHWYSVEFNLDGDFITSQALLLKELGFDVFVVDAGWYESVGNWTPSGSKFKPDEFENALLYVRNLGIPVGLWTCPWLLAVSEAQSPAEVDRPGLFREFMHAYALDLAGIDFTKQLLEHVRHLYHDYGMRWWKYDQEFLGEQTRQGAMKNMLALQSALSAARKAFPELVIENCMSGGRMINEFTDAISSVHWIRDGGRNGLSHMRSNVAEALGAAQVLPLHKVQRWTNRIDEINDEEILRAYCRSAMIGVWGISADLRKLSAAQKQLVQAMAEQYRTLNKFKRANIFETSNSAEMDCSAVTFYSKAADSAAVLVYRLKDTPATDSRLFLHGLQPSACYGIRDVDLGTEVVLYGHELAEAGWRPSWPASRRSGLFYIQSASCR
jgi:hypothetical protein